VRIEVVKIGYGDRGKHDTYTTCIESLDGIEHREVWVGTRPMRKNSTMKTRSHTTKALKNQVGNLSHVVKVLLNHTTTT